MARTLTAGDGVEIVDSAPNVSIRSVFLQAGAGAVARTMQEKARELPLSVKDFGAVGDGVADDTAAIQAALTRAQLTGRKVWVPVGAYKVSAALVITSAVTVEGEGWQPYTTYASGTTPAVPGGGSWFLVTHTSAPLFDIKRPGGGARCTGVKLRDFAMRWVHPAIGAGWAPTVYDWAVLATSVDDLLLDGLFFQNPYRAVRITGSLALPAGRLTMRNCFGQPLSSGVDVDFSADVSTLDRIHWWPFWTDNANVLNWVRTNGIAFRSARNDNGEWNNLFAYGYRYGVVFDGNASGVTSRLMAKNIGMDDCPRGFWATSAAAGCSGQFGNFYVAANPATAVADLFVNEAASASLDFNQIRLSNSQANAILNTGSGAYLRLMGLWCDQWNISALGFTGISTGAGATTVSYGSRFTQGNGGANTGGAGTNTLV